MDERMTETAKLADLILPVGTFLERDELCDFYTLWGVPFIMMRKKIIEHGQSRSLMDIWLELAHSLGFDDQFPWNSSEEVIDYVLEPSGLTVRDLLENKPDGFEYGPQEYRQYEKQGFKTPSGKIELYSELLAGLGIPPLPALHKREEIESESEIENVHFHFMGSPDREIIRENPWEYYVNNWLSK